MLNTAFPCLAIATVAGLFLTPIAEASPRFTIENNTDRTVKIDIYSGDDTSCLDNEKRRSVGPFKTKTFGCTGDGKGKCKVQFSVDSVAICGKQENTCGGKAVKMDGGARAKVSRQGRNFKCVIS